MNTFGSDTLQVPLYDPRSVILDRARFRREMLPMLEKANSFYCPVGCEPSRGWILLSRGDYNKLDKYSTTLQLNISDTSSPDNVNTLHNLSIVQAQCVTRGIAQDLNALYLVEITDGRGILCNQWFQFPITAQYNVRAPAYPQTFHPQSINSGSTWTWETMLENIWNQMSSFLGEWTGLPSQPNSTPEGFWLSGIPALPALCHILEHIGMVIVCDLTQSSNPFTIVEPGTEDTELTVLQSRYLNNLEDDLEFIDVGAARVPKTIKVLFRKRYSIYGTEETVRYDSPQWNQTAIHTISIDAPSQFSSAVGTHHLWSDFTIRHDMDGNALAEDIATATVIANDDVNDYFRIIYHQTLGAMHQTYAGALPFKTGSRVDKVCWYQDYRTNNWLGWRTQIMRGIQQSCS